MQDGGHQTQDQGYCAMRHFGTSFNAGWDMTVCLCVKGGGMSRDDFFKLCRVEFSKSLYVIC